jgi:hypothetical protein
LGELGVGGGAWWLGEAGGRGREGHRAVTFAEASMLRANSCGHGEENRGWSAELVPERSPAKLKGRSFRAGRSWAVETVTGAEFGRISRNFGENHKAYV